MPPTFTQQGRLLTLSTPLGADVLLLERLTGAEELSALFHLEIDTLCPLDKATWTFDQLLGQPVTATVLLPDDSKRYLNGIVARISQGGNVRGAGVDMRRFRLAVVPKAWFLTLQSRSRIFQQLSVPDILKKALTGLTVSWELQGTYEPRDYCTQYRESDWAFACRLMEEEGIYFYFKHGDGSHQMVVADTPSSHVAVPGPATVRFHDAEGGLQPEDRVYAWHKSQEIRSGKVTLWDNCFELPDQNLEAAQTTLASVTSGTVTHKLNGIGNDALEVYEFPGRYAQRFDGIDPSGGDRASDVQKIFQDNKRTASVRMRQEAAPAVLIEGEATARQLSAGHKFTLADHFDADGDYVLTQVTHDASLEGTYGTGESSDGHYSCRFRCIPAALPFAPAPRTPRPLINGPQTATVVGPSGEEIFTDKYGRVKVQFHWDRDGKKDANSSCWVRVGSIWAGKQWGAVHVPRIGHEVVVAFEDGDPDRPIIVGNVYNAANMPPYLLPDNKTQSGIKTRSTLQGDEKTFNELRFEDKKDSEEIYFHAEKDFNRVVENNDTLKVGFEKKDKGDQTIEIFNNQNLTVGAGKGDAADGSQTESVWNNQKVTVGAGKGDAQEGSQTVSVYKDRTTTLETGNDTLTVKKGTRTVTVEGDDSYTVKTGNRSVTVSTGNDTHKIEKGNRTVEIAMGNDALTVKMGNQETKVNLGKSSTEAMQGIELKVGQNSIKIDQSGITLQGMMVKVQGQVQVQVQGAITQVSGDGMLQLKGGVTMIG